MMKQQRACLCFQKLVVFHASLWLAKLVSEVQHHSLDSRSCCCALDIEIFEIFSLPVPNCTFFTVKGIFGLLYPSMQ